MSFLHTKRTIAPDSVSNQFTVYAIVICVLIEIVTRISETEFEKICRGIYDDRDSICKHNPIGTPEETLLWMLLSCLVSYLSVSEIETPCFTGIPTAETYRQAILFVLKDRMTENFDAEKYLDLLK